MAKTGRSRRGSPSTGGSAPPGPVGYARVLPPRRPAPRLTRHAAAADAGGQACGVERGAHVILQPLRGGGPGQHAGCEAVANVARGPALPVLRPHHAAQHGHRFLPPSHHQPLVAQRPVRLHVPVPPGPRPLRGGRGLRVRPGVPAPGGVPVLCVHADGGDRGQALGGGRPLLVQPPHRGDLLGEATHVHGCARSTPLCPHLTPTSSPLPSRNQRKRRPP